MTHDEIRESLLDLLEEVTGKEYTPSDLHDNADLAADLGLDSVDSFSLLVEAQERFKVHLGRQDILDATVGKLITVIQRKLSEGKPRTAGAEDQS